MLSYFTQSLYVSILACIMHTVLSYVFYVYFFLPELNECDPDPCLNGGTCVDGVRNYTCNCATFPEDGGLTYYAGRNCGTGEKQK